MDIRVDFAHDAELNQLETHLQTRFNGRVRNLRLTRSNEGIVLCGTARSYYAKQLAQHAVMEATALPIAANAIEVV